MFVDKEISSGKETITKNNNIVDLIVKCPQLLHPLSWEVAVKSVHLCTVLFIHVLVVFDGPKKWVIGPYINKDHICIFITMSQYAEQFYPLVLHK